MREGKINHCFQYLYQLLRSSLQAVEIWCRVNGEERQRAVTKDMLFSCTSLISFASRYFTLEPGDIILTGTPAGVGPVRSGDRIQAGMEGLVTMEFEVAK